MDIDMIEDSGILNKASATRRLRKLESQSFSIDQTDWDKDVIAATKHGNREFKQQVFKILVNFGICLNEVLDDESLTHVDLDEALDSLNVLTLHFEKELTDEGWTKEPPEPVQDEWEDVLPLNGKMSITGDGANIVITDAAITELDVWTTGLMGGDAGHGGETSFDLRVHGGCLNIEEETDDDGDRVSFVVRGDAEGAGLAHALYAAGVYLKKKYGVA